MAAETAPESEEALFDVVVHLPSGANLEAVLERAINEAGIEPGKAEALINALRSVPSAKVGAAVTRARAEKAKADLVKAGLRVEINPILSLQTMKPVEQDTRYRCPACEKPVELGKERQCPACGVFVDKVTEDFLLRKKIMEQEKAKLEYQAAKDAKDSDKRTREQREADMRRQVREELEKELGLNKKKGLMDRFPNIIKAVGGVALLAVGFLGGRGLMPGTGGAATTPAAQAGAAAKPSAGADVDKMLATVGDKGGGGASAADAALGDPALEDSLMAAGAERRSKGKGISVEQAVAASKTLAASVGHKMPGEGGAGGGGGGGAAAAGGAAAGGAAAGGAAWPLLAVALRAIPWPRTR